MKKRISKLTVITTLLTLLPIILGAVMYDKLPDMVITHWGFNNEPNGWSPKWVACFGIPLFMAVLNLIISIAMEEKSKLNGSSKAVVNISRWVVPVLSIVMMPMTLFASLGVKMDIEKIVNTLLGVVFVVIGNYLPKCRQNHYVGIKLPWTFESEENWNKTHRLGGYVWMLGGIVVLISTWVGASWITMVTIFAMVLIPCVYSYMLHRRGV